MSFLTKLLGYSGSSKRSQGRKPARRCLQIDHLEERTVPSTFVLHKYDKIELLVKPTVVQVGTRLAGPQPEPPRASWFAIPYRGQPSELDPFPL